MERCQIGIKWFSNNQSAADIKSLLRYKTGYGLEATRPETEKQRTLGERILCNTATQLTKFYLRFLFRKLHLYPTPWKGILLRKQ